MSAWPSDVLPVFPLEVGAEVAGALVGPQEASNAPANKTRKKMLIKKSVRLRIGISYCFLCKYLNLFLSNCSIDYKTLVQLFTQHPVF
jgi:hypothetical protein